MLNLGFFELTLFGMIALIVLGPDKLLVTARTLGRWYGKIKRASHRLQSEFASELQLLETKQELQAELDKIRQSEAQMRAQMQKLEQSLQQTQRQSVQSMRDFQSDIHNQAQSNAKGSENQPNTPANNAEISNTDDKPSQAITPPIHPEVMYHTFFLLGDYDRRRRLPCAPFLPNYLADPLLYQLP